MERTFINENAFKKTSAYLMVFLFLSMILFLSCRLFNIASPTQEPSFGQSSLIPATATVEIQPSTETLVVELPAGFKEYQDPKAGIIIFIPSSWEVTGIIEGLFAIFLSYPADKYIGGEILETGDTKCDLNIQPPETSTDDLIEEWKSDSITTIISEEKIILGSGQSGIRFEIDSMGRSNTLITEIKERVIILNCYGDFSHFDEIAATLHASE